MKTIKYFIEFISIISLFCIFKILGMQAASMTGSLLGRYMGPLFRSKKTIEKNINIVFGNIDKEKKNKIINGMWSNIGRTFAEYMFLKNFRYKSNNKIEVKINGINYLEEIKKNNEPVIFFSGHFANFELMPMNLDKSGVKTVAIYRPLNNFFLDPILQYWRMKYVCPNYIQKGRMGIREIISRINNGYSIALMVDQRISEGPRTLFFNKPAHTTTIPAQIALKYNCRLVPISLERKKGLDFEMNIHEPYKIQKTGENEKDLKDITLKINSEIEKMILKNPTQWMWPHNRWK